MPHRGTRPARSVVTRLMQAGSAATWWVPAPVARQMAESTAVVVSRRFGLPDLSAYTGDGEQAAVWTRRRQLIAAHLHRVLGYDPGRFRTGRMVDEAVASYARYWAESLRIPHLDREELEEGARYEGFEHITRARAEGRGTILFLPHLGGWEWCGAHLAAMGHPVSVVVEKLEPPDLFEWFAGYRESLGMQVIPVGPDAASRCARALADNHILCLLSDRVVGGSAGVEVEFFGERTTLPAGAATLALRSGAALLPCAVYFGRRTDSHLGYIMPPMDTTRRGRLREDVTRITQDMARILEDLIRRAPTQWHLMQPNWPSDGPGTRKTRRSGDGGPE